MKDMVATVDYKAVKNVTLNGKYELGTKKYQAGATWDGTLAKKGTTLKVRLQGKLSLHGLSGTFESGAAAPHARTHSAHHGPQLLPLALTHVSMQA